MIREYADQIDLEKNIDFLGELYQSFLTKTDKQGKGIIFTPFSVIDYILHSIGFPTHDSIKKQHNLIDISSGSGLFLVYAIKKIINLYSKEFNIKYILDYIQDSITGFDINPIAVFISKFNIALTILYEYKEKLKSITSFSSKILLTNSLDRRAKKDKLEVKNAKTKLYDYVVGNPPYIEAKRMDKKTKTICLSNFPKAARAHFDVYSCFLELGIDMLKPNGKLGYIIPSKFLSSRHSKVMRNYFLENNLVTEIIDLAHQKIFRPAVYPIILILNKNRKIEDKIKLANNIKIEELKNLKFEEKTKFIHADFFNKSKNRVIFFPESISLSIIEKMFNKSVYTFGDLIKFRWAISFHKKGLRDHFIYKIPINENSIKFLGGKPYGGNREIERYGIKWKGYFIDYNHEKAISFGNNFPDINIFKQEKIIICQHALRIRATLDKDEYVCKDIFLLGHLTEKAKNLGISLELILSFINSELYSFLYSVMFSSTEITGKYLHYLPMYLHDLPMKIPDEIKINKLVELVNKQLKSNVLNKSIDQEIDDQIYNLFELSIDEKDFAKKHINQYLMK